MTPLYPTQLPANSSIVGNNGSASVAFSNFLLSLFSRTGGQSGIPNSVGASLVAAGASLATALILVDDYNEVLTGSGGVALSDLQPGQVQWVYNGLGGSLNVYPNSALGQINALGNGAAFVLGTLKTQIFWCTKLKANGGQFYRTVTLG